MKTEQIILIVLLGLMVVVLIVLPMFTNKKRAKAVNDLHSSVKQGDIIKTVGGVIGKVISVNEISPVDKEMVIETGIEGKKTTMVFDIQAVYQIVSKVSAPTASPYDAVTTADKKDDEAIDEVKQEIKAEKVEQADKEQATTVDTEIVKEDAETVAPVAAKTPTAKTSTAKPSATKSSTTKSTQSKTNSTQSKK